MLLAGLGGCCTIHHKEEVIAVPGETVPHKIAKGEVSEYDGWVLPTPLFNRLTPCFKDVLEAGDPDEPMAPIDMPASQLEPYRRFPSAPRPWAYDDGDKIASGRS